MRTSTKLFSVALMSCSLAGGLASIATAAPKSSGAATSVAVSSAKLQADGSVLLGVGITCPAGSTYSLTVIFSQAFQGNGTQIDAVAYAPDAAAGTCTGKSQKLLVSTGPSQRAGFIRDSGATRTNPPRIGPSLAQADLAVTASSGATTSASGGGGVTLR